MNVMGTMDLQSARSRQRGVTLVEVLVTVVVISVGLLGVAALQMTSLRDNYSSYVRGQATALADDIIDRIRANRDDAASYAVAMGGSVSGTTVAAQDVTEWKSALQTMLPQAGATPVAADGSIAVQTISAGRFSVLITIQWGERNGSSGNATRTTMTFQTRTEV
jgi:type IV pilus assembly protein PilV